MAFLTAVRVSRAPIAGLAGVGVFWGAFAAYVPDIKAALGASDSSWGTVMVGSALGGMLAMYMAPRFIAALGRVVLPVAGVILALCCLLPALPSSLPEMAAALFVMGIAVSLLDMSTNVRISVLEERHKLHLMNVNHAMFSFAFAGAALGVSLARQAGLGPHQIVPFVALACLAFAAATYEGGGWQGGPEKHPDAPHQATPWGVILPAAAILFSAFVCENATEVWSALHIERTLGGAVGQGGFGPMMLGLMMGVGRVSGQFAAAHLGEARLVRYSAMVGIVGAMVLAGAPSQGIAVLGVGLLGLGVAVTVPSANSILGRLVPPEMRGFAISRAWLFGFTGFFLGPTILGLVSQLTNLRIAFVFVALVMASVIPAVRLMQRRGG